jgi:hypothetical protein
MRFLIDNYANSESTEPYYLNATINNIDGCVSHLWNRNQTSAYDIFDIVKPDIFIAQKDHISLDALKYMNEHKNIGMIINVTGFNNNELLNLDNIIQQNNLNVPFVFNNGVEKLKSNKINVVNILNSADIYLLAVDKLDYKIDKAIIVQKKSQVDYSYSGTYHYLSTNEELVKDVDIVQPVMRIQNIYGNYSEIVFKPFHDVIPQIFFDAILNHNNVSYECDGTEKSKLMNEKIHSTLGTDKSEWQRNVKSKHTCLNRTKSLLSQLPCNDMVLKLGKMIEEYK